MRPMNVPNPQLYAQRQRREGVATENHKILYKVAQVFPNQSQGVGGMGQAYTLRAGQHEYPFRMKIPFNNGCMEPQAQQQMGLGGFGLSGLQQMQYRHVKRTLPPSLTGFPGEAEIRYYVKVTVQRPSIFKENRRSAIGFRFMPIEPPRPPKTTNESYARRPFQFTAGLATYAKKSSMFKKKQTPLSDTAPQGEVDARLPSPAILTCNEPLPLRLLVRKLNESPEQVFLMSLQVQLFGQTEVRAMDISRTETSTWVLMSLTGLSLPIGSPSDAVRTESLVDSNLWDRIPLPNTVAPSFHTCNLTRRYELEVRVGLGYGVPGEIQVCFCFHFAFRLFQTSNPSFIPALQHYMYMYIYIYIHFIILFFPTNIPPASNSHPPPPLPSRDLLRHPPPSGITRRHSQCAHNPNKRIHSQPPNYNASTPFRPSIPSTARHTWRPSHRRRTAQLRGRYG